MVSYVTQEGINREFSDIAIVSMKDNTAKLIQHLTSIENGNTSFEKREASLPILTSEERGDLYDRLNKDSNIIINSLGKVQVLQMAN
jgi:hypothetical protein